MNINPEFLNRKARRSLALVGILCLSIILPGADEGCLVEQKCTEGLITFTIKHDWATAGWVEANDSDSYTLTQEDIDAIADAVNDLSNVDSIGTPTIAGAKYKVTSNTGHVATRAGNVTVNGQQLLDFSVVNEAGNAGEAGDGTLTILPAGVTEVSNALDTFVQEVRASGSSNALDGFTFNAAWTSTPPPGDCDPPAPTCDTFSWTTELIIQVPITFKFDGPA